MTIGKSALDQAFKLYAKWCERNGVFYQQPFTVTEAEFFDSLKFENMHGTLIEFELDENGKVHVRGTTCHEKIVDRVKSRVATKEGATRPTKKAPKKVTKKTTRKR